MARVLAFAAALCALLALVPARLVVNNLVCSISSIPKIESTQAHRCPCFLSTTVTISQLAPELNVSVYVIPESSFDAWNQKAQRAAERGNPSVPRPPNVALELRNIDVTNRISRRHLFGWKSGTRSVNASGNFIVAATVSASARLPCASIRFELESQPKTCPLRLAPASEAGSASDPPLPSESINTQPPSAPRAASYVVGGTRVSTNDEFAAYNALLSTLSSNCSASVIAPDWVLTAAHCQIRPGAGVRVGGTVLGGGERRIITQAVSHPNYVGQLFEGTAVIINDVAVARLNAPVSASRVLTLNSNSRGPVPGTIVRATGYGKVTTTAMSSHLHFVDVAVLSSNECRRRFYASGSDGMARGVDGQVHVCTGRDDDCTAGGVCFGDSGGPIVARTTGGSLLQIGVTSYGLKKCGTLDAADVFARVSQYVPWIQKVTNNAVRTASWKSINNNGSGSYGSENSQFPRWALIAITVFGGLILLAILLFMFAFGFKRRTRAGIETSEDTEAPVPIFVEPVSPSGGQQSSQATRDQQLEESAPYPMQYLQPLPSSQVSYPSTQTHPHILYPSPPSPAFVPPLPPPQAPPPSPPPPPPLFHIATRPDSESLGLGVDRQTRNEAGELPSLGRRPDQ